MADELRFPSEGMSTIGAQFTLSAMKKVTGAVQKLIGDGWKEEKILRKMREELRSFRPFTIQRLYDRAAGKKIDDDIRQDDVLSEKVLKQGTVEIEVTHPPKGVESDCLIQFRGCDWYVARVKGKTLTLKLLR